MRPAYKNLLLCLFGETFVGVFSYAVVTYAPDFAKTIILLIAVAVIWYDRPFPKTVLFWLPLALGLFCAVVWKITGEEVWGRLAFVCIWLRAAYRVFDWAAARPT
jgi:hypothetical protein